MNSAKNFGIVPAFKAFTLFTVLTGIFYPAFITGVAQLIFPDQANGSFIHRDGKMIGSSLIGQEFKEARYFNSRPSAVGYNATASGASNAGPTSGDLKKAIEDRVKAGATADLLFASGSGLDPHISVAGALAQVSRVAKESRLSEDRVKLLVEENIEPKTFGFLGEARVNVLKLNLNLLDVKEK